MKRILKSAGFALLFLGLGALIGGAIVGTSSSHRVNRVVINGGESDVEQIIAHRFDEQIAMHEREVERIVEEIKIEPEFHIPPIPELPQRPNSQVRIVHQGPSFFQIIGGIANMLTAVFLIGIGIMVLVRRNRQPKEKQPES